VPSAPSVPVVMSGVPEVAVPVPSAAAVVADPARVPARAQRGVSTRAAVRPPDLTSVATVNAQINSGFDSLANLLTGLPQGPVADFLGGALLLARRSLFNQAPTAAPVQYGQTETDIVGTLGAVDVEGDPITYIVSQAPQHGTVSIDADGFYSYIPTEFATTDSTDTFTVSVADSATRLLGPISTNVVVPVSITGVEAPPPQARGLVFWVYNWSQHSVKLLGIGGDREELGVRPKDLDVIDPGHSFRYVFDGNTGTVSPDYLTSNGVYLRTELSRTFNNPPTTRRVEATGGDQSSIVIVDERIDGVYGTVKQFILDPPNTSAVLPADKTAQTELINWMCGGGPGNCSFGFTSDGVQRNVPDSPRRSPIIENQGSATGIDKLTVSYTQSVTQSSTNGYELNAAAKFKFGQSAGLAIGGKWAQSWTKSSTETWQFSQTIDRNVPPWSYNVLLSTPNVDIVTGDVIIQLWNTTWKFKDVTYSFPANADCKDPVCSQYNGGKVVFRTEPTQPGFRLQDVGSRFPNSPVYVLGVNDNKYPLKVTAFNGVGPNGGAFFEDFTGRKDSQDNYIVQWATSNADVATVDAGGNLTVKAPGSATITATYAWNVVYEERTESRTLRATLPITVTAPNSAPVV
jgi:VCBS repeat-containing protein